MDTTLPSLASIESEAAVERAHLRQQRAVRVVLTVLAALVAVLLVGACTLQFTERALSVRTAPTFSRLVAWAVSLVVVVALPLWWERHRRRAWRALDPALRRPRTSWVLPWSLLLVLALPAMAPDLTRAALTAYGAWMAWGLPLVERPVARAVAAVGRAVPRETFLTLTHRTLWPWVDRASPECVGPAPATAR